MRRFESRNTSIPRKDRHFNTKWSTEITIQVDCYSLDDLLCSEALIRAHRQSQMLNLGFLQFKVSKISIYRVSRENCPKVNSSYLMCCKFDFKNHAPTKILNNEDLFVIPNFLCPRSLFLRAFKHNFRHPILHQNFCCDVAQLPSDYTLDISCRLYWSRAYLFFHIKGTKSGERAATEQVLLFEPNFPASFSPNIF